MSSNTYIILAVLCKYMHIQTFMYVMACFHIVVIVFICLTIVFILRFCYVWVCLSIFNVSNHFCMYLLMFGTLLHIGCIFLMHAGSLCRHDALHRMCVWHAHTRAWRPREAFVKERSLCACIVSNWNCLHTTMLSNRVYVSFIHFVHFYMFRICSRIYLHMVVCLQLSLKYFIISCMCLCVCVCV